MLFDQASKTLSFGDSLLLSGIGMLVVFMELMILALMILLVSKIISRMAAGKAAPAGTAVIGVIESTGEAVPAFPVDAPAPAVDLYGVDEPTAAVIMALVAHNAGIAPERLAFRSIRLIEEE